MATDGKSLYYNTDWVETLSKVNRADFQVADDFIERNGLSLERHMRQILVEA